MCFKRVGFSQIYKFFCCLSQNLNEQIQLTYPNEMMEFREKLFSEVLKSATISSEATFTFTEDHLNDCLQSLAQSMIRREKYTYER